MNFASIIKKIEEKGKIEEMINTLIPMFEKLPSDARQYVYKHLECIAYTFSLDEAKAKVIHMTPYGEYWSYEKVVEFVKTKGVEPKDFIHYYLVMNMMYNDYYQTAEAFGLRNNVDFYFWLAKNFIDDPDGVDFKVEKYFSMQLKRLTSSKATENLSFKKYYSELWRFQYEH